MENPDWSEQPDGRLPMELAARLEPELRDALDHPLRREILRSLTRSSRGRTPMQLAPDLGSFRLSQVTYHVLVLARDGAAVAIGDSPPGGRSYLSNLSGDPEVAEVLRATRQCDRRRLRLLGAGANRFLSSESER